MTSIKIAYFSRPSHPLSIYVQDSSTPYILDNQCQTNHLQMITNQLTYQLTWLSWKDNQLTYKQSWLSLRDDFTVWRSGSAWCLVMAQIQLSNFHNKKIKIGHWTSKTLSSNSPHPPTTTSDKFHSCLVPLPSPQR